MATPDFTRAARRPSERRAIVEHVLASGPGTIETDYLEWKSSFDLGETKYRAATAKHILAFVNRDPARAKRNAEGYAYLLIGVEPGNLVGAADIWDPEKLEAWITPYIGHDVRWDADYVEVQDEYVLFITVDPPRWGDPPRPLCKEAQDELGKSMRDGWIYIRRPGKSEQAGHADITMLTTRARAGARTLSLALELVSAPPRVISAEVLSNANRDAAIHRKAQKLLRGMPQPQALGTFMTLELPTLDESRTRDAFRAQVQQYQRDATDQWPAIAAVAAVERGHSPLRFQIRNSTDEVFESVQLEAVLLLHPTWVTTSAAAARELLRPPEPPTPWGRELLAMVSDISGIDLALHTDVELEPQTTSGGDAQYVLSRFAPLLVRPHTAHPLAELFLMLPPTLAGHEITVRWRATSRSTSGELKGELALQVEGEPPA